MEPDNPLLDDYVLGLAESERPRVCFLPTASGDSEDYIERFLMAFRDRAELSTLTLSRLDRLDARRFLLSQDVVYVGGGSTVNLLARWREHRLDAVLREAWRGGVVLAGISAGAMCWFEGGVTDSFGPLEPLADGLGFLPGSFCPHYDGEPERPQAYRAAISEGLPAGLAVDDGAAAHFLGGALHAAVASRPSASVRRVELRDGRVVEEAMHTAYLGPGAA